jgi:hypothetical protein
MGWVYFILDREFISLFNVGQATKITEIQMKSIIQANEFAAKHGAAIGRYKPGAYYVSYVADGEARTVSVSGKTFRVATTWIEQNLPLKVAA